MPNLIYKASRAGLLLVDPYNDFLSEGGKVWDRVKEVAGEVNLLNNLRAILAAARQANIRVFVVPHRRWEPGDYEDWDHPNPTQLAIMKRQSFARGTWGADWHPDFFPQPGYIILKEHSAQPRFSTTTLSFPLIQQRITHVITATLLTN